MNDSSSSNDGRKAKPGRLVRVLVGGLPLGLFLGVVIAAILYVRNADQAGTATSQVTGVGFTRELSSSSLQDRYQKFESGIGVRTFADDTSRAGVKNAELLIRGSLNMSNMGFKVVEELPIDRDGVLYSALWVDVLGQRNPSEIIEVRVSYDQPIDALDDPRIGSLGLAVALEVANAITGTENRRTIRFSFVPDGFDQGPVSNAYDAIYDNRQLRTIAGFDLATRNDLDPKSLTLASGEIDWSAVLVIAERLKSEVLSSANQ